MSNILGLARMPLLSPALSPTQVLLESRSGAALRPSLSTHSSFSSSSTACSSPAPRNGYRPTLTPEVLLEHAFGSSIRAVQSASARPIALDTRPCSSTSSDCSSFCGSKRSRRDTNPNTPPRGTFRSVTKLHSTSLPIAQLNSFGQTYKRSSSQSLARDCDQPAEREPMMSNVQWREKAEERLEQRRLRRATRDEKDLDEQVLPLDIDCRPMEGSLGFPPSCDLPRDPRSRARNSSGRTESRSVSGGEHEAQNEILEKEEKETIKASMLRSKSMDW